MDLPVVFFLVLQISGAPLESYGCTAEELKAIRLDLTMMARGDEQPLARPVEEGPHGPAVPCVLMGLSRSALLGWLEARAVAPKGGPPDLLAPVRSALNELAQLQDDHSGVALEIEYAQTSIRAAVAAAQDERPEMELLLTHARDLSERLVARGRRAIWPRSFNLLAGELWLEVDRFDEARAAYERAVVAEPSDVALVGLARAQARLGLLEAACVTYKRASKATTELRKTAAGDLAHCR